MFCILLCAGLTLSCNINLDSDSMFVLADTVSYMQPYDISLRIVKAGNPREDSRGFADAVYVIIERLGDAAHQSIYKLGNFEMPRIEKIEINDFIFSATLSYGVDLKRKRLTFRATVDWLQIQRR